MFSPEAASWAVVVDTAQVSQIRAANTAFNEALVDIFVIVLASDWAWDKS
jgi:hypothetical protein